MTSTISSVEGDRSAVIPRITVVLVTIGVGWLAASALKELRDILGPLLLALNLLIVAYPVQAWLDRRGVPRLVGAVVNGTIVFAILTAFFGALGWAITMLVQEIPQYQNRFEELYRQGLSTLAGFGVSKEQLDQQLSAINPSNFMGVLTGTLSGVSGALGLFVVAVTIIFVALIDSTVFPAMMQSLRRQQPGLADGLTNFGQGVRRYWVVTTIFGIIVAVIDVVALMIIGVPLALVWGVLAYLTNYIPNIGFVLGVVPPALMALLAGGPTDALLVIVAYSVINFVIQSVIQPKFNGQAIGVNATISLLSLLFWAWVLGPLGALLALPATLLAKTLLIDQDQRLTWLNAFVAADPSTADPDRIDAVTDTSGAEHHPDEPVQDSGTEFAQPPGSTAVVIEDGPRAPDVETAEPTPRDEPPAGEERRD
ncbi:MAG: AI-2E family transporter [Mobilicoccus sp.]|nr:AI-2E family transporter [Mobilicoccus sp.]